MGIPRQASLGPGGAGAPGIVGGVSTGMAMPSHASGAGSGGAASAGPSNQHDAVVKEEHAKLLRRLVLSVGRDVFVGKSVVCEFIFLVSCFFFFWCLGSWTRRCVIFVRGKTFFCPALEVGKMKKNVLVVGLHQMVLVSLDSIFAT